MAGDVKVTARGMEVMEVEAELFVDGIYNVWLDGHFGSRIEEGQDATDTLRLFASGLRDSGVEPAPGVPAVNAPNNTAV